MNTEIERSEHPNRDILCEIGYESSVVFENPDYDDAILGVDQDGHVIYDFEKMVGCLMDDDGMTYEEAVEFIEYNTIRALPYIPEHPVVLYRIDDYKDIEVDTRPVKERYTPEERYQILLTIAEKVWGKKLSRFKTTDDVRIRMFISYTMWNEGYSYEKIGKVMGRAHASCINHVRRMRNVFDEPVFYALENEKYNEFSDLVADYDEHRS